MNSTEIAKLLRVVAEIIESNAQVAKAIEEHFIKNSEVQKAQVSTTKALKEKAHNTNTSINGEFLLAQCRVILRESGEEELRKHLIELKEQVREILKHGQLDPKRSVRKRKNLNSIIEHIVVTLKNQSQSGLAFANSILPKT